jgi:S1-C subfamily serine protease
MELPENPKTRRLTTVLIGATIICLIVGGIIGYGLSGLTASRRFTDLEGQVSSLQSSLNSANQAVTSLEKQVSSLQSSLDSANQSVTYENTTFANATYVLGENVSLSQLYEQVKNSVVVVEGLVPEYGFFGEVVGYGEVLGSGFVYNSTGRLVIVTNYHVVESAVNVTVTFANGDGYAAKVIGLDPYVDLAVLSTNASQNKYFPIGIMSSLTLRVGDPVVAIGTPLGFIGSMTSGIVSALGRSVSVDWSSYAIADCIQTTAPINPGNSGGPLINYQGDVVGITSYGAVDPSTGQLAQGIGLAIPSSTILREIASLVTNGSYKDHAALGASGTDMNFYVAQAMGTNVTYGWLIERVTSGGAADKAGLRAGTAQVIVDGTSVTIGGDIIIAINGTRITNSDALAAYLEEYTLPGQTINVTMVRNNQTLTTPVTLEARPPLAS